MPEYERIDVLYLGSEVMTQKNSIRVFLEIDDLEDPEKDKKLLDQFLGVGQRITTAKLIGVFLYIAAENRKRKRKAGEVKDAISEIAKEIEKQLPGS